MKKKQQDFQKVKLKVGKHLPKGRNETKTSFQTKKINLREQIKQIAEESTLKELLRFMKSADVKTKYDNLRKLLKYVSDNKDDLPMFFPDLLKELGRTLQESDPEIRSQAILVLGRCVDNLTDAQFRSFVVHLTSYINCMMTHITFKVKQDSLKLLDVLLNSHPSIICQSTEILFYLFNMISCKESATIKKGGMKKDGRRLIDFTHSKVSDDEWRMQVLERMGAFLSGMLSENNCTEIIPDHEKEVYWNAKEALYLPLYLNSGVKPAKFDYSVYSSVNFEGSDSRNFKQFMHELICIISPIIKSVLPANGTFSESTIKYLTILTRILCCIGEWAIQNLDVNDDLTLVHNLMTISSLQMFCFPCTSQAGKSAKRCENEKKILLSSSKAKVQCVYLNLEIAYLYCLCSFLSDIDIHWETNHNTENFSHQEILKTYLAVIFEGSGVKMNEKSISLTLKICRILIQCKKLDSFAKHGVLVGLLGALETHKFSSAANDIYSYFMDLSLNDDHKYFLTSQAMRNWFQSFSKNLSFMLESKVFVPNYLNYIKQICARRNEFFMETLNNLPFEKLIEFLKFDDEDFQLTIIHLIVSLDEISPDLLQDLAETIRPKSFSLKSASKLIRMLHCRFSASGVSLHEQMNFLKFLLNLGCDTFLILDPSLDTKPLPMKDMLINFQQSFACQCEIYAIEDSERYQEIFKVCAECLPSYLRDETLGKCTLHFIRSLFSEHVRYPVHSLVAMIDLFKRFSVLYNDQQSVEYLQHFVYSCLFYNSCVTNDVVEENWAQYCVPAVQDCLDIIDPGDVISCMDSNIHNFDGSQIFHTLRVLIFLMQRHVLDVVDKNILFSVLSKLRELDDFDTRPIFGIMLRNLYNNYFKHTGS